MEVFIKKLSLILGIYRMKLAIFGPEGSGKTTYLTYLYLQGRKFSTSSGFIVPENSFTNKYFLNYMDLMLKGHEFPKNALQITPLKFKLKPSTDSNQFRIETLDYPGSLVMTERTLKEKYLEPTLPIIFSDDSLDKSPAINLSSNMSPNFLNSQPSHFSMADLNLPSPSSEISSKLALRENLKNFFQETMGAMIILDATMDEVDIVRRRDELENFLAILNQSNKFLSLSDFPLAFVLTKWDQVNISEDVLTSKWFYRTGFKNLYSLVKEFFPSVELFCVSAFHSYPYYAGNPLVLEKIDSSNLEKPILHVAKAMQHICKQKQKEKRQQRNRRIIIAIPFFLLFIFLGLLCFHLLRPPRHLEDETVVANLRQLQGNKILTRIYLGNADIEETQKFLNMLILNLNNLIMQNPFAIRKISPQNSLQKKELERQLENEKLFQKYKEIYTQFSNKITYSLLPSDIALQNETVKDCLFQLEIQRWEWQRYWQNKKNQFNECYNFFWENYKKINEVDLSKYNLGKLQDYIEVTKEKLQFLALLLKDNSGLQIFFANDTELEKNINTVKTIDNQIKKMLEVSFSIEKTSTPTTLVSKEIGIQKYDLNTEKLKNLPPLFFIDVGGKWKAIVFPGQISNAISSNPLNVYIRTQTFSKQQARVFFEQNLIEVFGYMDVSRDNLQPFCWYINKFEICVNKKIRLKLSDDLILVIELEE